MPFRQNAARIAEIARILARHGWESAGRIVGFERGVRGRPHEGPIVLPPDRLRALLAELGPTYVKVGQILSTRADIIPQEYVAELEKLQDEGEPFPIEQVREVIEAELGAPPEEIFAEFDPEPFAAASLAQVHAARIEGVGEVVVKVQRPEARRIIETDIQLLYLAARALEATFPQLKRYDLLALTDELARRLREELDFNHEGRNTDRIRENMADVASVVIPEVIWDYCSSRVLVLKRIRGVKVKDEEGLRRLGVDRAEVAQRLAKIMFRQIYVDGLFHADPHPGNVVVFEDGRIGLLDFGLVGYLDRHARDVLVDMLLALRREDPGRFADDLLSLCGEKVEVDYAAFADDVARVIRGFRSQLPEERKVSAVLRDGLKVFREHRVAVPSEIALLVKTFIVFEGVCRRLDPQFDTLKAAEESVLQVMAGRLEPARLVAALVDTGHDLVELLLDAPRAVGEVLRKAARGEMRVNVLHRGLEEFGARLDRTVNRLAWALVVSACIVGSSILVQADMPPRIHGYPVAGMISFAVSGALAAVLLWHIYRSGRLG